MKIIIATLAAAATMVPFAASAQDAQARSNAAACAICHGTGGQSVTKDVVPLAGLQREHIVRQMMDFRTGKRPATVMHQIAKGYSDQEIDQLAAWFAAQKK